MKIEALVIAPFLQHPVRPQVSSLIYCNCHKKTAVGRLQTASCACHSLSGSVPAIQRIRRASAQGWFGCVFLSYVPVHTSEAFIPEITVSSPRKSFIITIKKYRYRIKVYKKTSWFDFEKASLVHRAYRCVCYSRCILSLPRKVFNISTRNNYWTKVSQHVL